MQGSSSLTILKEKIGMVRSIPLTIDQIKEWLEIFKEKNNGRYPSVVDKEVYNRDGKDGYIIVDGINWTIIDKALRDGKRGLPRGSSLSELKQDLGLIKSTAPLSIEKINGWIRIFKEKTGNYPSAKDNEIYERDENGGFTIVNDETWTGVNAALAGGYRGLPKGSSLSTLKEKLGVNTPSDPLTVEQITQWVKIYKEKTGKYPSELDKEVYTKDAEGQFVSVPNESWLKINTALRNGARGLPDGSSLAGLKNETGLTDVKPLKKEQIVKWIVATRKKTGKYPSENDLLVYEETSQGEFKVVANESWVKINASMRSGGRELEEKSSLAQLKREHGFVAVSSRRKPHPRTNPTTAEFGDRS